MFESGLARWALTLGAVLPAWLAGWHLVTRDHTPSAWLRDSLMGAAMVSMVWSWRLPVQGWVMAAICVVAAVGMAATIRGGLSNQTPVWLQMGHVLLVAAMAWMYVADASHPAEGPTTFATGHHSAGAEMMPAPVVLVGVVATAGLAALTLAWCWHVVDPPQSSQSTIRDHRPVHGEWAQLLMCISMTVAMASMLWA